MDRAAAPESAQSARGADGRAPGPVCALVVAAGRGARVGGDLPKQYRDLMGRPVLRYCLETFCRHPAIDQVMVVIHPDDRALYDAAAEGLTLLDPVAGGASRQESVRNGLEALAGHGAGTVLIHDAARPLIDAGTVTRLIDTLAGAPAALVALPVVDTIKRAQDGQVAETVPRDDLWRAQTPQAFHFDAILEAHRAAAGNGQVHTDDVAVAEEAGLPVCLVEGTETNFKITTEDDLARAAHILAAASPPLIPQVGTGFDVHAFGEGDHVWLCGVRVAHDHGLVGHSDADVGLHALTDAILGAIGAQDIGYHFSDKDPRWAGASSDRFLAHAGDLVRERGGRIAHLDLTLICEAPRLRPHHAAMVARVAGIISLPERTISIKATTTEKLGFTGRGEGLAAQAVATVLMPPVPAGEAPRA